ncbi:MAG: type II toxin-antitoxin system death-on-curing family toxin [Planctomycetota bacterium]|nr:type II toxin-antitoxin system death-on-curing family toxin [Planctomycetota bacterium]
MTDPRWLTREIVIVLHGELIAEHGGASGLRDEGALESALARPQQQHHYEASDVLALAARYAFGLCSNHPFVDGNKRLALSALDVFLRLNGWELSGSEVDTTATIVELASGQLSEADLAAWIRKNALKKG